MMRLLCCLLVGCVLTPAAQAQIYWPMVGSASPCAVQVGTTGECTFTVMFGDCGAYDVLVSGRGVRGEVVKPAPASVGAAPAPSARAGIKVRFTVAAGAALGIRDVRLLTPNGPSSLGQIVVVRNPVVREVNPNNTMEQAQLVSLPAALSGAIESKEDVDYYKFKVQAGAALTFHVYCQRLQNKLAPLSIQAAPMITLRSAAGSVLASNAFFFGGDPVLHHRFTTAGEYYLEVRDVRYEGIGAWEYVIEADDRPFVAAISPACLPPGMPTKVRLIGFNLPADPYMTMTLPADAPAWDHWQPLPDLAGQPLLPALVRPSTLPLVHETATPNDTPSQAQAITLPATVAGVIDRRGDIDCYAFQARKGERFSFQIVARPLNSELDSVLRILDAKGETLAENDDASDKTGHRDARNEILCPDSRIENWEAPADGRYVVEVSDVHGRGGPRFTYSLLARPSQPHFRLELSTDRTVVAPGAGGVIFVRSIRKEGFKGDIQLSVEGLPADVTAVCGSIPYGCQDGCILLRADDAKPRTFGSLRVIGKATTGAPAGSVVAQPFGELMHGGGARYLVPVNDHIVSTTDALDLKAVRLNLSEITLKPGEMKTVEVSIERRPGFQDPVIVAVRSWMHVWVYGNCLPEGVTIDASSQIRLTDGKVTGTLVFRAAANAQAVRRQLIPVMGEVSINFPLRMYYGGEPLWLTVEAAR